MNKCTNAQKRTNERKNERTDGLNK
jgi:hypothetical protein